MSLKKLTPIVICVLIFFVSGIYTPADQPDWNKEMATATAAGRRGEYSSAITLYKRAIESQKKALGPEDVEVAASLNNLAVLYQDESLYTEAEPLYRDSLAIWAKHPGEGIQVALCLNNLAALHH